MGITILACVATAFVFFALGWMLAPTKIVGPQELSRHLDRIVNAEGAEIRRNQMRKMLHDSGRRTMRLDGGPPATVHKMRRSKRRTIHPD